MPTLAGNPTTLFTAADSLAASGTALDDTGRSVRVHADLATSSWHGNAGNAARTTLDRSAGYATSYGDITSRSAPVITAYAEALHAAQLAFDSASEAAATATTALGTATGEHTAAQTSQARYVASLDSAPANSANAAEARAAHAGDLAAAVTSAAADMSAAQNRLGVATADMSAARTALTAADQAATAAITALTAELDALRTAIRTRQPAPSGGVTGSTRHSQGIGPSYLRANSASSPSNPPRHEESDEDGGWGSFFGHVKDRIADTTDDVLDDARDFVKDHAEGLKTTSAVLKGVSTVAGVLSFVPVLAPITAPIAVGAGAASLGIDAAVKAATGEGSWKQIAIDGALMLAPGVGKAAKGLPFAAITGAVKGARTSEPLTSLATAGAGGVRVALGGGRAQNIIDGARSEVANVRMLNANVTAARAAARGVGPGNILKTPHVIIEIDSKRWPDAAQHIAEAQTGLIWKGDRAKQISIGKSAILTVDRQGAQKRGAAALEKIPTLARKFKLDRDEYPPKMFSEGGRGASVKYIDRSDNRGSGAYIGQQLRKYANGTIVEFVVK